MKSEGKGEKVDLISDVVKFVSELNQNRYDGESILATLQRKFQDNFIGRYEYEKSTKDILTTQSLDPLWNSLERVEVSIDSALEKVEKCEQTQRDSQKEMSTMLFEIKRKADFNDFKKLKEKVQSLPGRERFKNIELRLSKTITKEKFEEVKSQFPILKAEMEQFVKKEDLSVEFEKSKQEIEEILQKYITKEEATQLISDRDEEIGKRIENFDDEIAKIPLIFPIINGLKQHLRNTVLSSDYQEEKKRMKDFEHEMRTQCLLRKVTLHHKILLFSF